MSTDDLVRRARSWATRTPWPLDAALVSELADEVDQLRTDSERYHAQYVEAVDKAVHAGIERDAARAEADRYRALWDRHGKNDLLAERDAARAALERGIEEAQCWIDDRAGRAILNALEGEVP